MGLVSNPEFMEYHKVNQVFLMLKLPYVKCGVRLLTTHFLGCSTRMGGSS